MARRERRQGYYMVKWNIVMLNKRRPGYQKSKSSKQRFLNEMAVDISEDKALWKEVITTKYGELNPRCTEKVTTPYGWTVWRTIRALWKKI
ncbi:hypothetical protein MTR67_023542 [Solanum verrucosum]|uniref:Uncharacterized protein n=1 Tax=Solanum verrucosum TaxID=315347 RepID=A0AAF0TRH2_SOLVR|nr:hypothetical protein MTR67_023542 [Solanum verrucosum]